MNSAIAMGVRGPEFENPVNQLARVMQVQGMQQQNALAQAKMGEYQRGVERQNKLASIFQTTEPDQLEGALTKQGYFDEALKIGKAKTDRVKADADARTSSLGAAQKQIELTGQIFGHVRANPTPENAAAAFDAAVQYGLMPAEQAQQFKTLMAADPGKISTFADGIFRSALSAKDQLPTTRTSNVGGATVTQAIDPVTGMPKETGRIQNTASPEAIMTDARTRAEGAANRAVTMRGQNMVDARAKEANGNAKAPAGYRWSADGSTLEPIPGGPAVKSENASEGERKAATLLKRLEFSEAQMAAALKTNPEAAKPGLIANGLRMVGAEAAANSMTGTQRQQVDAAQLDILDAALTLGTGAAYTREQLEGYRKSYFPQIGDDDATIKDKAARLKNVIDAAKIAAGRAAKQTVSPTSGGSPNIDSLLDKYK